MKYEILTIAETGSVKKSFRETIKVRVTSINNELKIDLRIYVADGHEDDAFRRATRKGACMDIGTAVQVIKYMQAAIKAAEAYSGVAE